MEIFQKKKTVACWALVVALIFGIAAGSYPHLHRVFAQGGAPRISNIHIADITEDSALIQWETNRQADSLINFGLDRRYGVMRVPGTNRTEHEILLDDLSPSTRYYFRIVSSDAEGNQAIAGEFTFRTAGLDLPPELADIQDREILEQILALLEDITEEEALALIAERVGEIAADVTDGVVIEGIPRVEPNTNSAIVRWRTSRPADSSVLFVPENQYNPDDPNPYISSQASPTGELVAEHEVEIVGLEPFTTYHFQVVSQDNFGVTGRSQDATFTTLADRPVVQNVVLAAVGEDSAAIEWSTTIPAAAYVEYENLETGEMFTRGSPTRTALHSVRLTDLSFGASYRAVPVAEAEDGDRIRGDEVVFTTDFDDSPPRIFQVTNESTLYPGVETRVQTLIGWETDKLSTCTLFYREGVGGLIEPTEVPPRDPGYGQRHVQVLGTFRPATVYQFWIECEDRAGIEGRSEDFVLFTPQQEKSILDIIIENFEGAFGWLGDIGG